MSTLQNKVITRSNKIVTVGNKISTGCGTTGPACIACFGGVGPTTIQATFSGMTLCPTTCQTLFAGSTPQFDYKIISGSAPNGTYCLTSVGSTARGICSYQYTLPIPIVIEVYASTNGTCSGGVTATYSCDTVEVAFSKNFGTYGFSIFIFNSHASFSAEFWQAFHYAATGAVGGYCIDGTYSTDVVGCSGTGLFLFESVVATGGSVSLVMDGCSDSGAEFDTLDNFNLWPPF